MEGVKKAFADLPADASGNLNIPARLFPFGEVGNGVTMDPEALTEWLVEPQMIPVFLNHDPSKPVGFMAPDQYTVDAEGVNGVFVLPVTNNTVNDIQPFIESGMLDGASIGISIDEFDEENQIVMKMQLNEVSVVWDPAFESARIQLSDNTIGACIKFSRDHSEAELEKVLKEYKSKSDVKSDEEELTDILTEYQKTKDQLAQDEWAGIKRYLENIIVKD